MAASTKALLRSVRRSEEDVAFANRGIERVDERVDRPPISFVRHQSRLALFLTASRKSDQHGLPGNDGQPELKRADL
ncbi:MAG TPA: hypothetical protein VG826_22175 [Pirellulales bacterium]|nr:hypothetical protein [Pirellulales bacterium]